MNVPLLIQTLEELTQNRGSFTLDSMPSEVREAVLFNLSTLLEDMYYHPEKDHFVFKGFSISDKHQEASLLTSLQNFCESVRKQRYDSPRIWMDEKAEKQLRRDILESYISPLFEQRYGLRLPHSLTTREANHAYKLVTWHSHLEHRDCDMVNLESVLDRIGIPKRAYNGIEVATGDLHIQEGHGNASQYFHDQYEVDIRPSGGDILLTSCYQATESAQAFVRHIHQGQVPSTTGVIHLEHQEEMIATTAEDQSGLVISGYGRYRHIVHHPNRFLRTSLQGTSEVSRQESTYTSMRNTSISLQRSPSGERLYLGNRPHFFENHMASLNYQAHVILQQLKAQDPIMAQHRLYDINLDFRYLHPKVGECIYNNILIGLSNRESLIEFHKRFVDPRSLQINYAALNALLINPQAYEAQYAPGQPFVPLEQRSYLWVNQLHNSIPQQTPFLGADNFEENMTTSRIQRSTSSTQLAAREASEHHRRQKATRMRKSASFSG